MRGFNLKNLSSDKGFTIIELTVVLTVISILVEAGIYSLYTSRRQAALKGAASELGAEIRSGYTKAISVLATPGADPPKAFGVYLSTANNDQYIIKNYIESGGAIIEEPNPVTMALPPGITISSISGSAGSYGDMSFLYSSPFGRSSTVSGAFGGWNWDRDTIGDIYYVTNSVGDGEIIITLVDENNWTSRIIVKTRTPDVFVESPGPP